MNAFKFINLTVATTVFSTLIISQANLTQASTEEKGIRQTQITGILRDFTSDHPDFERSPGDVSSDGSVFAFGLDDQITTDFLDENGKPIYAGGSSSTTNRANFDQWFNDVEGVNQRMEYTITLTDPDEDGVYTFARDIQQGESFFPLDGMLYGNENNSHNYHFTYEIETEFTYVAGTVNNPRIFTFKGDDDVYVYIDGEKVIDIGGVHLQREQSVNLDKLGLIDGETYSLKLFFAERHVVHSNFRIDTNIKFPEQIVYAD